MLDQTHFDELSKLSKTLSPDTIGDSMQRAIVLQAVISDPKYYAASESFLQKIRGYARGADLGWKVFEEPIRLSIAPKDRQIVQLVALIATLQELIYCFETIQQAALLTFENSAPVRFYINGIFHYVTALFLLNWKENERAGLPRPGTVIKVLHPLGLDELLDPIYEVLNRQFGRETSYGSTILKNRNKQFVHGSFSPEGIRELVKDTNIFDEAQKARFAQYHWDLYNRIIVLRLQLISLLTVHNVTLDKLPTERIYGLTN